MEDTLRDSLLLIVVMTFGVLILVLMEDTLRVNGGGDYVATFES